MVRGEGHSAICKVPLQSDSTLLNITLYMVQIPQLWSENEPGRAKMVTPRQTETQQGVHTPHSLSIRWSNDSFSFEETPLVDLFNPFSPLCDDCGLINVHLLDLHILHAPCAFSRDARPAKEPPHV